MTKARDIADSELGSLTVDTDTLVVDETNKRVGIGTSSPDEALHVENASGAVAVKVESGNSDPRVIFTTTGQQDYSIGVDRTDGKLHFTTGTGVGSNQAVTLDSSGNVGIGTSSPDNSLHIFHTGTSGLKVSSPGTAGLTIEADSDGNQGGPHSWEMAAVAAGNGLSWRLNSSEVMRIDSSGNVLVGKSFRPDSIQGLSLIPNGKINITADGTVSNKLMKFFRDGGTEVGSILTNGTSTSYNTSSDERLKENIADAQPASDLIDAIRIREFDWRADGEHQRYGVVAQELEPVAPEAVTKGETEEDMWSVDYSKLVPMLVKEIQDLRKRVATLENAQ